MGRARHDLELPGAAHLAERLLIHVQDDPISLANDQQGRRRHQWEQVAGQIRAPAPRNHRRDTRPQANGRHYVGVPVHLGLITGDQMIAVADLAERVGGDVRLTRQQNFVLTNVDDVAAVNAAAVAAGTEGFAAFNVC